MRPIVTAGSDQVDSMFIKNRRHEVQKRHPVAQVIAINLSYLIVALLFYDYAFAQYDEDTHLDTDSGSIDLSWDDPMTPKINEGAIGAGWDDPMTPDINEGSAGWDDPMTPDVNEANIGTGWDDPLTPDVNEGAFGSGFDDLSTPDYNEGAVENSDG